MSMEENRKPKINKKELWRTLKYALIAVSAGVIQFATSTVLKIILDLTGLNGQRMVFITDTETTAFISETVGLVLSVLWNCTFNRKYTFKAANNVPVAICLALVFYVPFYPFQIWYMATVQNGLANIGIWGFIVSLITCMIINGVLEFLWQRFVVFRGAIDTNDSAKKQNQANDNEVADNAAAVTAEKDENQTNEE